MTHEQAVKFMAAAERDALNDRITEYERLHDLTYEADMRGIKLWQAEAPGRELTWPDKAHLVKWLLDERDEMLEELRRASAALSGDGWRLAPVEPTEEMLNVGDAAMRFVVEPGWHSKSPAHAAREHAARVYKHMLAASPSPIPPERVREDNWQAAPFDGEEGPS